MALPLSAGRVMMFSICWRDFKDVDCFLVMFFRWFCFAND